MLERNDQSSLGKAEAEKEQQNDTLRKFSEAIAVPLALTDSDKWPIRSGLVIKLCQPLFSQQFFGDIQERLGQGETIESIAAGFGTPSRIWRMGHHLLNGLDGFDEKRKAALLIVDLVSALKHGDPFCQDGQNIIWSPEQVQKALPKTMKPAYTESSTLVHRLTGMLWGDAEAKYFVAHEQEVDIHGPYALPDGNSLLVRDFSQMQPTQLWPEEMLLPKKFESVQIFTTYRDFDSGLDVYNNLMTNPQEPLKDKLQTWEVLINGQPTGIDEMKELIGEASKSILGIGSEVAKWSTKDIYKQYMKIFWLRKQNLNPNHATVPEAVLKIVDESNIEDPRKNTEKKQLTLDERNKWINSTEEEREEYKQKLKRASEQELAKLKKLYDYRELSV